MHMKALNEIDQRYQGPFPCLRVFVVKRVFGGGQE
jgi:hypothetical protein